MTWHLRAATHFPARAAVPEMAPATLAEDLLQRDFSVNAIAVASLFWGGRSGRADAVRPEQRQRGRVRLRPRRRGAGAPLAY
jgi:hypothetical protein